MRYYNFDSISLKLENRYVLFEDGIRENYGVPSHEQTGSSLSISSADPVITKRRAGVAGSSKVSMYNDFIVNAKTINGTIGRIKYRLSTSISYLAINKTEKKIKVRQAWNLTK